VLYHFTQLQWPSLSEGGVEQFPRGVGLIAELYPDKYSIRPTWQKPWSLHSY
jgi:hypothetical protein